MFAPLASCGFLNDLAVHFMNAGYEIGLFQVSYRAAACQFLI